MVSFITSASLYLRTAAQGLAQTSYGPYLLRIAAHWNLPAGACVGYGVNIYKKLAEHPAMGITIAIATVYFGGASAAGGFLLGASAAGRDIGIPQWVIPLIDLAGKATIISMLTPLGAFTIGMPLVVRCFIGGLAFTGYHYCQESFTELTATLGLITLNAFAGTAGVVTFIALLFLSSSENDPETIDAKKPRFHNFRCRFSPQQMANVLIGGELSSIEALNASIQAIKNLRPSEQKEKLITFARAFDQLAKDQSGKNIGERPLPTQDSKFEVYKIWYRAWSSKIHPDKNPGANWSIALFQVLGNWYSAAENLKGKQIEE